MLSVDSQGVRSSGSTGFAVALKVVCRGGRGVLMSCLSLVSSGASIRDAHASESENVLMRLRWTSDWEPGVSLEAFGAQSLPGTSSLD